ncbi:MAG: heavy-metal-associated domain-containing protein [Phycisphaerae bacterium]
MKLNFLISGMHCEACVAAVARGVGGLAGVRECDARVGEVTVTFDESVTTRSQIISAIQAAGGFEVRGFSPVEAG